MFNVADEICTRLLDHKCFTSGELRYFVKQFEELRNDRESVQVDRIEKNLKEIIQDDVPAMKSKLESIKLNLVDEKLDNLLALSKALIDLEGQEEQRRGEKLSDKIRFYEQEKLKVLEEIKAEEREEDEIFKSKAQDLRKYYHELESKWTIDDSHEA